MRRRQGMGGSWSVHVTGGQSAPAVWQTKNIGFDCWTVWYVYCSPPYFLVSVFPAEDDVANVRCV